MFMGWYRYNASLKITLAINCIYVLYFCIYKLFQPDSVSASEELIFDQVVKWLRRNKADKIFLTRMIIKEKYWRTEGNPFFRHGASISKQCGLLIEYLKRWWKGANHAILLQTKNTRLCKFKKTGIVNQLNWW